MYFYLLLSSEQRERLEALIRTFEQEHFKEKSLYEVDFSMHRLKVFERQSRKNTYCVDRKVLKGLKDAWLAEQVIKSSFGSKTVEFVPKESK
ncbi:MAG: hypothetical protein CMD81_08135 [Gammaproteobacteria bacterium]|nr:hypothetical protein [Gammaproteobacteria bacterium]MBK82303.1 hypothetical protein [Gammaproteobacteria bacterium]MBK83785.1 hypothetical protein [Gammaproteobacteria bacterium]|tara:strand:- start:733 stop:1008 length:276 start_codon:yes stop_codon:yes gene_type:complete